jgi:hypothetical protein
MFREENAMKLNKKTRLLNGGQVWVAVGRLENKIEF